MKRSLIFIVRLLTVFAFAGIIAIVSGFILSLILQNSADLDKVNALSNSIVTLVFGVIFGYRLHDLIRDYTTKKDAISPEVFLSKE